MDKQWLTISEMADTYQTTLRALRYYEERGLLTPVRRAGQRLYSPDDRVRLALVIKGKRLGFTIAEIKRLIDEPPSTKAAEASRTTDLVETLDGDFIAQQIATLVRRREEIGRAIDLLEDALATNIAVAGPSR